MTSLLKRAAAVAVVALMVAGLSACPPPSKKSPVEVCYDDYQSCQKCCDLLDGMVKTKCEAACECTLSCCKEDAGAAQPGSCNTCESENEPFSCEPSKARDGDGDGYNFYEGDCDDSDPAVNPDANEVVNGVDDNCDGFTDEDLDGDGFTTQDGDCDDTNPSINPLATEVCNDNIDNNCNGATDADEPDGDGDGFGPCEGDCNDSETGVGPGAVEDTSDGVDNDCDGETDEERTGCDCVDPSEGDVDLLQAMEICNPNLVANWQTYGESQAISKFQTYGAIAPRTSLTHDATGLLEDNCHAVMICSGVALDTAPQSGTSFGNYDPDPLGNAEEANDLAQIIIQFQVPSNVQGIGFDFMYLSCEYPEYVCTMFNDTFYAIEVDAGLNGGQPTNISFDSNGNEITVNNNFFENPNSWTEDLTGTGYDVDDSGAFCNGFPDANCTMPDPCPPPNNTIGSGTGWLRTVSPVTPGGTTTLTFSVHDEGDGVLDSCVIIDNFRWITSPVDGPGTVK